MMLLHNADVDDLGCTSSGLQDLTTRLDGRAGACGMETMTKYDVTSASPPISILLYGCETWVLHAETECRIQDVTYQKRNGELELRTKINNDDFIDDDVINVDDDANVIDEEEE
ncbi:hypothetical protein DPMN_136223 [Dreissena polymorpha]|uniref:Uncharacterized protein n=1 Tax=Dreissena polymorpha TaxID=45954 RepID=A0A9D4JCG2_DREPO|nr:hypothetical protein DPMN_136223 [Dreissena polymorpha]